MGVPNAWPNPQTQKVDSLFVEPLGEVQAHEQSEMESGCHNEIKLKILIPSDSPSSFHQFQ